MAREARLDMTSTKNSSSVSINESFFKHIYKIQLIFPYNFILYFFFFFIYTRPTYRSNKYIRILNNRMKKKNCLVNIIYNFLLKHYTHMLYLKFH